MKLFAIRNIIWCLCRFIDKFHGHLDVCVCVCDAYLYILYSFLEIKSISVLFCFDGHIANINVSVQSVAEWQCGQHPVKYQIINNNAKGMRWLINKWNKKGNKIKKREDTVVKKIRGEVYKRKRRLQIRKNTHTHSLASDFFLCSLLLA